MVSDFAVVKHALAFGKSSVFKRSGKLLIIFESFQYAGTFGVNVIAQVCGVNTGVGGNLLFVERLDEFEGFIGREAVFTVTFDLQRGEVKKAWSILLALFSGYVGDNEV